jgi:hypothetical protein
MKERMVGGRERSHQEHNDVCRRAEAADHRRSFKGGIPFSNFVVAMRLAMRFNIKEI